MASEQVLEEKSTVVETNAAQAEAPSIHGSGDSMWDIGQDGVDTAQDYTYGEGGKSTYHFSVDKPEAKSSKYGGSSYGGRGERVNTETAEFMDLKNEQQPAKTTKAGNFQPTKQVRMAAGQKPSALSELGNAGAGAKYTKAGGTLDNPDIENELYEGSLFIGGTTHEQDVRQGTMGDCYFLAALLSVIHADPNLIPKIMSFKDGRVRTMLYHCEGSGDSEHWVARPIETEYGMMSGRGSYYRIAYNPTESVWSANVDTSTLRVTRKDMYEAALWVNCIEQAYIYYAKLYGHYGQDLNKTEEGKTRDGFSLVTNGGWSNYCMRMFLGDEVDVGSVNTITDHSRETGILESTKTLVLELMKFAMTQSGDKTEDTFICLAAFKDRLAARSSMYARSLVGELEGEVEFSEPGERQNQLKEALELAREMSGYMDEYAGVEGATGRENQKTASESAICSKIDKVMMKLAANKAMVDMGSGNYLSLRSLVGTIVENKGSDIYMIKRHAYNVAQVNFKDKEGKDIKIDNSTTFSSLSAVVDLDKSRVVLENPWGSSHGVLAGDESTRRAEGCFESSLRECLASVTDFSSAVGKNHRHDNDANAQSIMDAAVFNEGKTSKSSNGDSYRYEYWDYDYESREDKVKGDVVKEADIDKAYNPDGTKQSYGHLESHEGLFDGDYSDSGVMLDANNKPMDKGGKVTSNVKRNNTSGKKYEILPGVRTGSVPGPSELYKESQNGVEVAYFRGSFNEPNVSKDIEPGSLFIDGAPQVRDIIQGDVGDCYFLSAVLHVLNTQPNRIRDMIAMTDGEVDVAFYHKSKDGINWTPVHIRSKWGVNVRMDNGEAGKIIGSKVRIDNKKHGAPMWQAKYNSGDKSLNITRKDMYQAALWVQALENAYSLFAAKPEFGPYGDGTKSKKSDKVQREAEAMGRYGEIHFGVPKCLSLFFGGKVGSVSESHSAVKDDNLKKGNDDFYQALLNFANAGQTAQGAYINNHSSALVASISAGSAIARLQTLSKKVVNEVKKSSDPAVKATSTIFNEINSLANTKGLELGNSNMRVELNNRCVTLAASHSDALSKIPSWHLLQNAIGTYVDAAHNRSMSGEHAYNVKSVILRDSNGAEIKTDTVKDLMKRIDVKQSQIVLQNPHGTNRPAFSPQTTDPYSDTQQYGGEFNMSLEEFIWCSDTLVESKVSYLTYAN